MWRKTTLVEKCIGGRNWFWKDLSVCCEAVRLAQEKWEPQPLFVEYIWSNLIIFWQLNSSFCWNSKDLRRYIYSNLALFGVVSVILGNAAWNSLIIRNENPISTRTHLFLLICRSYWGWNTCILSSLMWLSDRCLYKCSSLLITLYIFWHINLAHSKVT